MIFVIYFIWIKMEIKIKAQLLKFMKFMRNSFNNK